MRTYLVTGGAGFIGSNYIHYMFRKYDNEIRIINVDALTYAGNLENLKDIENRDNYTFVKANICDKEAIAKIFAENDIDRVVHFAAESHVDRSIKNPEVFVQTNVLGTAVMLNCAKNAWELPDGTFKPGKKFLHVSRIDQQILVTQLGNRFVGSDAVQNTEPKLRRYLYRNSSIMMAISTIHLLMLGKEGRQRRKKLWQSLKKENPKLYRRLRLGSISGLTCLPGAPGAAVVIGGYRMARRIWQFQ